MRALFLSTVILSVLALLAPAAQAAPRTVASCDAARIDKAAGVARTLSDCGRVDLRRGAEGAARQALGRLSGALRVRTGDLSLMRSTTTAAGPRLRFQQYVGGVPVRNGQVTVALGEDGAVQHVASSGSPSTQLDTKARVSRAEALLTARRRVPSGFDTVVAPTTTLVGEPTASGGLQLAWHVVLATRAPRADWNVLVSARSGEVLKADDADHARRRQRAHLLPEPGAVDGQHRPARPRRQRPGRAHQRPPVVRADRSQRRHDPDPRHVRRRRLAGDRERLLAALHAGPGVERHAHLQLHARRRPVRGGRRLPGGHAHAAHVRGARLPGHLPRPGADRRPLHPRRQLVLLDRRRRAPHGRRRGRRRRGLRRHRPRARPRDPGRAGARLRPGRRRPSSAPWARASATSSPRTSTSRTATPPTRPRAASASWSGTRRRTTRWSAPTHGSGCLRWADGTDEGNGADIGTYGGTPVEVHDDGRYWSAMLTCVFEGIEPSLGTDGRPQPHARAGARASREPRADRGRHRVRRLAPVAARGGRRALSGRGDRAHQDVRRATARHRHAAGHHAAGGERRARTLVARTAPTAGTAARRR